MSSYDAELLDEEDEDMPVTERDLADDAQWKIIQKNTFTRWANEHLKTVNKSIALLDQDFADGLRLIGLVEVLSGKKFKHVNRRPNFRTQKLENVTMVLEFLERDEGIRIVNIDSGDIVDSRLKLILGLIWTLILHYSISMPMWEGEDPQPQEGGPTPKQRLLNWIQNKIPDLPIKNLTSDFNDGRALGALVDALAPGLCPDWEDWDPKKAKENAKEALDAAEKWLDVPQLIKPEEITNPKVDDLSMMTYLSQFPHAKVKPGAPLRPRLNANRVRAFGPGLEPKGNRVGQPAKFSVETFSAGKGELELIVLDPKGKQATCESVFTKDRNQTYACAYVPAMEGEYRVIIKFGTKEIHKSPFLVKVEGAAGDSSKVKATGPGIEKTGVVIKQKTYFEVFTKGAPVKGKLVPRPPVGKSAVGEAGKGEVTVTIMDPSGHKEKIKPAIKAQPGKEGVYLVEYTTMEIGLHSVNVSFCNQPIPNSPFGVNVSAASNAKAVYATGRGIQPRGIRVKQHAEFKVHTKDAGKADVAVQIIGPGGVNLGCKVTLSKTEEGVYECLYIPPKIGQYVINITFGGQHITKSPFRVDVGPEKFSKVVAFGPGLEGGVVNQPACFTVETNGETGALGFSIEGPSQAKIDCKDNGDGSADVTYWPTTPGEYAIHILCNEEDIPQAPYMAQILPATTAFDSSKVIAKGPGLEPTGIIVGKWTEFTVDTRKAGKASLHITCLDVNYKPVNVEVKDNKDGTFSCKYNPKNPVKHTIIITWGTVGIPKSPFRVTVQEPTKPGNVKVYGPGVEKGVKTFVKTSFKVDCRSAGPGDVAIALTDERGKDVPVTTTDNKDGTFTVEYEPKTVGVYVVSIFFAEKEIPLSPIKVKIESSIDLSKVVVKGLETSIKLSEKRTIRVITSRVKRKDAPCTITVTMPSGKTVELTVRKTPEGYGTDFVPTESGKHKVTVTYAGQDAPDSPFTVMVESTARLVVKGLETPIQVDEARLVTIITSGLPKKDGPCKVTVTTPKKKTVELPVKKSPEGYTTTFTPTEPGTHKVEVVYDKKPAPDSPFTVEVQPKKLTPEVVVKGLETPISIGETRPISIITSSMPKKDAPCKVTCTNPKGKTVELPVKKSPDGYTTSLKPTEVGPHKVEVTYDKKPVPKSPFTVEVEEPSVKVTGLETPIQVGENRPITIDTSSMPKKDSPCKVSCTNPKGKTVELPVTKSPEGYTTTLKPTEVGPHKVEVKYNNKPVPKSPFTVEVKPEEKDVKPKPAVEVIGLDTPVQVGEKRPVKIVTTNAPKKDAPCKVTTTNPKGRTAEMKVKKTPEGYEGTFSPWDKGTHIVKVEYDTKEIPESPFEVIVEKLDLTKVIVQGLDTPIELGSTRTIIIITKDSGRLDSLCKVYATSEKKETIELTTKLTTEGYMCDFTPTMKGKYTIKIEYGGKEVPKSPFEVFVETIDISGVIVKGLETPVMVTEKRPVTIDTTSTGRPDTPCKVSFLNPKNATTELPTSKKPTGHETVFCPTEMGPHKVKVEVAGQEVPGSPFPVTVEKFEVKPVVKGLETPVTPGEKRPVQIIAPTEKTSKFGPGPSCTVSTTTPKGKTSELKVTKASGKFETEFSSREIGEHTVKVEYNSKDVPGSPFTVVVDKKGAQPAKPDDVDVSKIQVKGLEKPVQVGENRPVIVDTTSTGKPDVPCKLTVTNPKGQTKDLPTKKTPEGYEATFAPLEEGPHVVKVEVANKEVPKSPFPVKVEPKMELSKVEVKGLDKPIMVGEKRPVEVKTGKTNQPCKITATNPKGKPADVPTSKTPDGYQATFAPLEPGPYVVKVEVGGQDVPKSPFKVDVEPKMDLNKVEVKGLETPVKLGEKRPVTITTDKTGNPEAPCTVTTTGPKGKPTECPIEKTKTGYEATFAPLEEGPHVVKVDVAKKEIPKSPFKVAVEPKLDLTKVDVKGLEKPVEVDESRPVLIVTKDTGDENAPCKVTATTPSGRTMFIPTKKGPDGFESTFKPKEVGPHEVKVEYGGIEVPKSPMKVEVEPKLDIKKVQMKGLEKPIPLGETRELEVVTKTTGKPNLPCKLSAKGPNMAYEELPLEKTDDGYKALYTPKEIGPHDVHVIYADKEVPNSPFYVNVESSVELTEVTVEGLESPIEVGEPRPVTINTASTGKPDAPCRVTVTNPRGLVADLPTQRTPEGYGTIFAPAEPGPHKVNVNFAGQEVPRSPFPVNVEPRPDVGAVNVRGLETPIEVGEPRPVTIDTSNTGRPDAPCWVGVTNPRGQTAELPVQMTPNGYQTVFAPLEPGPHRVNVNFAGQEVPRSPFPVNVEPRPDVGAVYVKGLDTPIEVGEPRPITIDTSSTGRPDAPCWVGVTNPRGQTAELPVQMTPNGYQTVFAPQEPGPHRVNVNFAGQEVPRSPFPVNVEPRPDVGAVYVKGLDTPIEVGEPRPITIDTSSTGRPDAPCWVGVTNPRGQTAELPVQMTPNGYQTVLAPLEPGPHRVNVNFAGKEVPRSPFPVNVEPRPDVGAVYVKGLDTPIEVGEPRPITIDTSSTGRPDAPCWVGVTNPRGQTAKLPVQMTPNGYQTVLAPLEPGPHRVNVSFAGYEVPRSPFAVYVEPRPDAGMVQVFGLDSPIQVDEARPIKINTASTGKPDAPCRVTTSTPQGQVTELVTKKTSDGYQAIFAPLAPGPHKVNVNFAGQEVPKSPFTVDVEPRADVSKVDVLGLEKPIKVAEPRPVTIMTSMTGKPDAPCTVRVTNPRGETAELPTRKIPEGYTATLAPAEEGPHKVNVLFDGIEVPKSPFNVMAEPAIDFSKVKVTGLDAPVEVGEIRPVTIDTVECGVVDAPCQVTATNPVGQVRELPLQKTPKGYEAQFAPLEDGPHMVAVKYAGKELPKSPFPVEAKPQGPAAAKVKVYGPGLEKGTAKEPCHFTIDTREVTQPGGLGVTVEGPAESKIECRDNQDGTCDVTYHPTVPGDYSINVTYAEEHVTHSPFTASIKPSGDIDVSNVKAYGPGLEPGVFLDSPTGFTVDAKSVMPNGEGKVRAIVTSPTGQRIESLVKNNEDGTYDVLYTPYEQGPNTIDVTYEDIPIPESPVQVNAAPGCDASRVRAYGPGLDGGITEVKQTFTVDVKGAGQGGLALAIDGPAETQINCKDNRDGTCEVEYVPVKPGDYDITIKFADQHIPGSPFNVKTKNPVNPAKVQCYGPGLDSKEVEAGKPATFTVDTTEAGEAPLEVTYTDQSGLQKPAEVVPVSEGKFNATYYPVEEGKCKVEVKYANQHVPNSPFNMSVEPGVDADKVKITGDGIQPEVLASMPCQFVIDCREAGIAELDVVIQRPDGTYIRPSIQDNNDGTFTVQYTPEDLGPYKINVTYGEKPVKRAPFRTVAVPTGDATKCRITEGYEHTILVERKTVISIDASDAGPGKVTCRIRSQDGTEIDIDICENVDGSFSIMFTPSYPGDYKICIKFGGETIPDGEYIVQAVNSDEYEEYLQKKAGEDFISPDTVDAVHAAAPGSGLFNPIDFKIPVGPVFNFVTAYVTMPSGKKAYPKIDDNKDGSITVRYQPTEIGLHELTVCYNQQPIEGSPFQFHVDAVNSGFVTAYGPGLSHGVANEPTEFTIVTKDAGAGGLALAIEGPSKTEIKCKDNDDGTCTVSYVPTAPGEYNITVKFADKHISGSPFTSKITPGEQRQRAQLGRSSEVSLKVTETDITNLTASIRSPAGHEEPCMLKRLPNGHLGISFTPREVGEHLVNVFRDGKHIADSPFKIYVGESELGNATKVRVYGKGLEEGNSNEVNEFIVDTREAGYGGLSLSIEGPSKADIECHDNEDGTCRVTYKPTEPGTYIINIKFADEHVPGSPYKVKIGGEPSERITERIMRHREAADVTHVGSQCELSLKIPASFLMRMMGYSVSQMKPGTSPFDMTASVTSPSGVTELCDVVSLDDCHYSIKFVPQEMGVHTVSVKHKDMHIPGSPFEFTVGPIAGGGAHKVHAAGLGLVRGEVDQKCEFNIYTREAGAGGLSIAIEGPSKADVGFEDRKDGSCGVNYTVSEPGEYIVSIKFNDEHIPDSPFRVPISPSIGDARKISVSALQNKGLQIGKPCAFMVNFNGAPKGKITARVVTPSATEDEALIQEIDDGEYAIRFIPRENGPHLVYVSFDGCQIPDSPFRIQVGTIHADPGMVTAYGDGLRTGKTGSQCKFIVNTCNAGAGALAVTVEGPSKVKLECKEVDDGYEFTYNPTAPGDYLITIRYAGTNIAASPFKAKIEGPGKSSGFHEQASVVVETVTKTSVTSKFASLQSADSDASKVTCEGNGLKKGYRNKQCAFTVDTSQAGRNMLFIGMMGPKGPCEELTVKHMPAAPYKITYIVKERGEYMLAVKWGEDHIPGSPFIVKVD